MHNPFHSCFQHIWGVIGEVSEKTRQAIRKDSSRLVLKKGYLSGDTNVTFTVQIVPEDDPQSAATARVDVRVASKGVTAKLAADTTTVSESSDLRLDGSLSVDNDNKNGALKFNWFCVDVETKQPCYDSDGDLLVDSLSEEMDKAKPVIPAGTLSPGR